MTTLPAGWKPIESAPKDELILVGPTKRMGICVAMNSSEDGWVTETINEWHSMYTPTHWMPLPAAPCQTCNDQGAVGNILTAQPCPDCTPPASAQPESMREGYPHDDPQFVALCREHDILGTAMQGLVAVFWRAASSQGDAKDEQAAFERWLFNTATYGDADAVQRQWEASSDYADFHSRAAAPAAGDALAWQGLTDAERDGYVGELADYGTDFVAPLYAVVESIERRLRDKNAAIAQQSQRKEA